MSDDPAKFIIGDTAISALEEHPDGRRGMFGRKRRAQRRITHCENCGTELTGKFCPQCGQPAIDYRRSFRHVIVDALDSFLNWDSKFFHTIALLVTRPWRLTNEFLAGHRMKYLHPARLYLLVSIVFFFVVTYGIKSIKIDPVQFSSQQRDEVKNELLKENVPSETVEKVDDLLERGFFSPAKRSQIEEQLKDQSLSAKQRARLEQKLKIGDEIATNIQDAMKEMAPDIQAKVSRAMEEAAKKNPNAPIKIDKPKEHSKEPKNEFESWIESRAKEKFGESGDKAQLFFITLFSNLPYMMLACIPLFAFVLKILYIRKRIFYIDHLVYALHIHTFAYLVGMTIVLFTIWINQVMPGAFAGWMIALLWVTFAVQIFLSIRRVYRQGWFFSVFKFFVGGFVYLMVLCVAIATTFFITLALP